MTLGELNASHIGLWITVVFDADDGPSQPPLSGELTAILPQPNSQRITYMVGRGRPVGVTYDPQSLGREPQVLLGG